MKCSYFILSYSCPTKSKGSFKIFSLTLDFCSFNNVDGVDLVLFLKAEDLWLLNVLKDCEELSLNIASFCYLLLELS